MNNNKHNQLHISLVIPAYNDERYLKTALDSVARQTVMPNEVIVVDNNSTDKTVTLAKSYSFVRVIHEDKQGVGYANYAGFMAASSELVARIDTDTILSPNWIETALAHLLTDSDVAAITGKCYFYDAPLRRTVASVHTFFQQYLQSLVAGTTILWASNMVVRKDVWLDVNRNQPTPVIHEDVDLSLKLKKSGFKIKRDIDLVAEASLIRSQTSLSYIWEYLMIWPDTYSSNHLRIKSYVIRVLGFITFVFVLIPDFIRYTNQKITSR